MITSTNRQSSRFSRVVRVSAIALLLVAAGCSNDVKNGDPTISAKVTRSSSGKLEALTVKGSRFTPDGPVLITTLLSGGPYVEQTVQADANGKVTFEGRPLKCPEPAATGSWVTVIGRDMTSGISGSVVLSPGGEPDCKA